MNFFYFLLILLGIMRIESSVAVVTGGASGLGEAVVRLFHDLGCKVAI